MEGFVNSNIQTPFLDGLKRTSSNAVSSSEKTTKDESVQQNNSSNINISTKPIPEKDVFEKTSDLQNVTTTISDIDKNVIDTVIAPNQNKRQRLRTALAISGSAVAVGGLSLLFTKGKISKTMTSSMSKLMKNVSEKIQEIKEKPTTSKLEGVYLSFLQKVNRTAGRVRGTIFNITPIKDVLFSKVVREKCHLKKPCDAITKGFRKLSLSTVKSSYRSASRNIDEMLSTFADTNARLVSGEIPNAKPVKKGVIASITQTSENIRHAFNTHFSTSMVEGRSDELVQKFNGLGTRVYNRVYGDMKGFVKDVDGWTTFVPEAIVASDKARFMGRLGAYRRIITNSPQNNSKQMSEILTNLEHSINPNHKDSREIVKSLRALTDSYQNLSGQSEANSRLEIISKMNSILKNANKISKSEIYPREDSQKISTLLHEFGKIVNTDKKGQIEEILSIYHEILPPEEYKKVKKVAQKAINSLNKAVHDEGFEYVDKVRDLAVGSALTDVAFGMGLPVTATSFAVCQADTKEKKRSVVLKYGIPLLVGVATSTLSTIKLVSGGKALMLGAFTSTLTNEICERVDKKLNKSNSKTQNSQNQIQKS